MATGNSKLPSPFWTAVALYVHFAFCYVIYLPSFWKHIVKWPHKAFCRQRERYSRERFFSFFLVITPLMEIDFPYGSVNEVQFRERRTNSSLQMTSKLDKNQTRSGSHLWAPDKVDNEPHHTTDVQRLENSYSFRFRTFCTFQQL